MKLDSMEEGIEESPLEEMDVDSVGDTHACSPTIIDPVVQHVNLPPEAEIPPTPDEIA